MEVQENNEQEVTLPAGNAEENKTEANSGEVIEQVQEQAQEKVIFRGREFASQEDATRYFEELEDTNSKLERERIEAEAYSQGIQDALSRGQQPAEEEKTQEDLEAEFYANPIETFQKVKESAKNDAISTIRQELAAERAWDQFCREYPELSDSRDDVVRILQSNSYIAKIKDEAQGRKELAAKVKSYYQGIAEKFAPTRELSSKKGQAVSSGSGEAPSVTQKANDERPLTFVEQIEKLRKRG